MVYHLFVGEIRVTTNHVFGERVQKWWYQSTYCGRCLGVWLGSIPHSQWKGRVIVLLLTFHKKTKKFSTSEEATKKCQQVAESLNLLVALRTWTEFWCQERVSLEVRSDNIAALTLVMNLKGSSKAIKPSCQRSSLGSGRRGF